MTVGIWLLGDQLNQNNSALLSCLTEKKDTAILLIESLNLAPLTVYHAQKLTLIWSAMRHFAEDLRREGWRVTYAINDNPEMVFQQWINDNQIDELKLINPSDRGGALDFQHIIKDTNFTGKINYYNNDNFLWQKDDFKQWTKGRKKLILEDFYRLSRKKFNILLEDEKNPVGGKWNLDKENRKPPKKNLITPPILTFSPDKITTEVMQKVAKMSSNTYGNLSNFNWAVTRQDALKVLDHFIAHRLKEFGTYQDAMVTNEEFMWHGLISPYINIGLLQPLEVIKAVENAYYNSGEIPLNSAEGFIRQVLGWREYMHGIYHHVDDDYGELNYFNHQRPLPEFFWDNSKTEMNCLKQVLKQTENTGYAHHIQRLMILSNYGLIAGISPQALKSWFHSAFIDAYDWVMQTNVLGMGQFADGGILASKPYASSANYVNKMSDYCKNCRYNYKERSTENACPFNYLYWDFLGRNEEKLRSQGRMNLVLKHLEKITPEEWQKIRQNSALHLNQ